MNTKKHFEEKSGFSFFSISSFSDAFHDDLGSQGTSGVNGFALLRSNHSTNQGGQIKFNAGCGNINSIHLSKKSSDSPFIFLQFLDRFSAEFTDQGFSAVILVLS